ncbi:hypothetical protein EDB92DRAFT_398703 [Lactarius akahatsu]|uniref:HNH nuclease domain-containing protein n=1 Tax=Lactarius akahatsu TaxID=416441 RepID=A0AAD4QEQ4_9AGAM|nr:hypothetical protein EDB92DRAFT_398703 [Lactarius akahatsu]
MSLPHSDSTESTCAVLACPSQEFQHLYDNERLLTGDLSDEALRSIIGPNRTRLREAETRCRLDDLLSAMLEHAPHPLGRRYVAVSLHVAREDGVVDAAKAWLDNLLLPMLAISKAIKTEPASSQTPTNDTTVQHVESASPTLRAKVALRERYHCAITKAFDIARARKLSKEGRVGEVPNKVGQLPMEAAHIIPFLLNEFDDQLVSSLEITWDMLRSWTQIDLRTLIGPNIDSPANAIYMTTVEHSTFGHFEFYLDKEAFPDIPNKYKVRMSQDGRLLTNGSREEDVEFPTLEESSVEPPNPDYLRVHAAFAKVLHLCGAAQYMDSVELDAEMEGTLRPNGETDFGSYLQSKLLDTKRGVGRNRDNHRSPTA